MSKFYSLFSSSQGNASYIQGIGGGVLVDIGVSCRRLLRKMQSCRISPESIRGILITHSHMDHIRGLQIFLKKFPLPVFASAETLATLRDTLPEGTDCRVIPQNEPFLINDIAVTAFPTMHDSPGSCGFRLEMPDGQSCAVCTDLGVVTPEVEQGVFGANLVLLESNYDPQMLRTGSYPFVTKQRIQSDYGHLSNEDSADFAVKLVENGTTRLVLGHLSAYNNTHFLAQQSALQCLHAHQMMENRDFLFSISHPEGLEQAVIF